MTKKTVWTTRNGDVITEAYCRKCLKTLPVNEFYASVDAGMVDTNGLMSVCRDCINTLFKEEHERTKSIEESLHKVCTALNILYNPDAVEATKAQINSMVEGGQTPPSLFSAYKIQLMSTLPKEQRGGNTADLSYKDLSGVVYVMKDPVIPVKIVPKELKEFWGDTYTPEEIEYMEREFANAKQTHRADTFAEIVLLKEVCYTLLEIKKERQLPPASQSGNLPDLVKELQVLFKNLAISPSAVNAGSSAKTSEAFGNWIADIERYEPAQWYEEDGEKYSLYADVDDVEGYFQKYFVRPLKNFITGSKDFNIVEEDSGENLFEIDDFFKEETEQTEAEEQKDA